MGRRYYGTFAKWDVDMLTFDGCYSIYKDDKHGTFAKWGVVITVPLPSGTLICSRLMAATQTTKMINTVRSSSEALILRFAR